ncbi:MAG: hypothetical protein QOD42_661 [Sphingomonadales bacterium]|nr:hypothetical protein [Sphingomonadales bacterium]
MAVFNIIGDSLISQAEFDARDLASKLKAHAAGEKIEDIQLANESVLTMSAAAVQPVLGAAADGVTPLPPIAFGQPMTIDIRYAYSGGVGMNSGDIAVVSGVKNWGMTKASARALNFLARSKGKRTALTGPGVFENGTNVVSYQKAVNTRQVTVGLEIAAAKKDDDFFRTLSNAFTTAGSIPLFLPHAGLLLAAGQLVPIIGKLFDALSGKTEPWTQEDKINFNLPGTQPSRSEVKLVARNPAAFQNLKIAPDGGGLVDAAGRPYAGDEPYMILAVYGGANVDLEDFTPGVVGADFMKRFYEGQRSGAVLEDFVELMRVASDFKYRKAAEDLKKKLADAAAGSPEAADLQARLDAAVKNILNPVMRPAA